jgi:asparaginyl-tRNA synthetase
MQTHPPLITSSDCEGGGEVFEVDAKVPCQESLSSTEKDHSHETRENEVLIEAEVEEASTSDDGSFFGSPKYLTVSSQLHLEALAQSVGKVWTLSPTFRAERADHSPRHLSEFYMLEAEVGFEDRLSRIMDLVEDMIRSLVVSLSSGPLRHELIYGHRNGKPGLNPTPTPLSTELEARWDGILCPSWPRITYTAAIDLLRTSAAAHAQFPSPPTWGARLSSEHERFLAAEVGRGAPVFVTEYPAAQKPFYMLPTEADASCSPAGRGEEVSPGPTVACFDLLVSGTNEIAGGSMREHRLEKLLDAMRKRGLVKTEKDGEEDLGSLGWYVDLRRWGTFPHGGFGLGFDRLLGHLAGSENIRDVATFPRWFKNCRC